MMECEITLIDTITAFVALLGVTLSGIALYLRRKDKVPVLNTTIQSAFFDYRAGNSLMAEHLLIKVSNSGEKSVTLSSISLDLKGSNKNLFLREHEGEVELPYLISVGESFSFWIKMNEFKKSLRNLDLSGKVEVSALANDGFGTSHESSETIEFDLNN